MVEAIRGARREPLSLFDRTTVVGLVEYVLPAAMVVVLLVSLLSVIGRGGFLKSWSADYAGSGDFLVESCSEATGWGPDQWNCRGTYTAEGSAAVERSTLVTSSGSNASRRPYVGERFQVFHQTGNDAAVYPLEYKLNELARLYLSFIPRLLFLIGSVIWLAGWLLTRKHDADDFVTRDSIRVPQRFGWRSTGMTWIVAGLLMFGFNHFLTTRVIGSLGIL
ncbi:MAG: hypothetical protein ACR2QK_15365 [Acidimicrobiales bacterium]